MHASTVVLLVPWISEESESVRLKFESSRKLNLKEYKPLRKGIAIGGIDVFVSIIKFIFTFVGDVKKTPKPRQLSVNHQLYDRRRPRSRQRSASPLVCDRRRPRPRPRSASHPVCDRRRPRPWQRSASRPVCDRRRPRPRQRSASRPVCDRRRPRPWQRSAS